MRYFLVGIGVSLSLLVNPLFAKENMESLEQFKNSIQQNEIYREMRAEELALFRGQIGQRIFVDTALLRPGQVRASFAHAQTKVADYKREAGSGYRLVEGDLYDAILTRDGIVIADGHHHLLAGISLGAKEFPIRLVADYSDLSRDQAMLKGKEQGYFFFYDREGLERPVTRFSQLLDDPNRLFASLILAKVRQKDDEISISKKVKNPVVIKRMGTEAPFLELKVANALYDADFVYDFGKHGFEPDSEVVEKARELLAEQKEKQNRWLTQVQILTSRRECKDLLQKSE